MVRKFVLITLFSILFVLNNFSQTIVGRVIDGNNQKPLPFVNIQFNNSRQGTSSDIDGRFTFKKQEAQSLHLYFVGYRDTTIVLGKYSNVLIVKLFPKVTKLVEVEILPGENPAHRIIGRAIENRKKNKPENLQAFTYTSYNKMVFTADPNPLFTNDSISPDTFQRRMMEFVNRQHIMVMESVSQRYFKKGKSFEKIIGSKVSGLQDPFFVLLATQFQSFSFYDPFFSLMDKNYINPISKGSLNKYFYLLQDTVYQNDDSVFIISFRPYKGKNFDGLKGLIYINSDGYAVQNVIAEPMEQELNIEIKIQQQYKKMGDSAWFPNQLNTSLVFNTVEINHMPMVGFATTYLDSIKINPHIDNKIFRKNIAVEIAKNATQQPDNYWNNFRADTLSMRDINTYHFMDSLGKEEHFDRKIKALKILSSGGIPVGYFTMPIKHFIGYNKYEKFRFGLGLETNEKLTNYFIIGGYGAWATGDRKWKYGGHLTITPKPNTDFKIKINYKNDLEESARGPVFSSSSILSASVFRNILIEKMNWSEEVVTEINFRALKHFVWNIGGKYARKTVVDDYQYSLISYDNVEVRSSDFTISELFVGFRFAFGEKIVRSQSNQAIIGSKYPVLNFKYSQGIHEIGSDFNYNRIDFRLDKSFVMRYLGKSSFVVKGGYIDQPLPWYLLYNGHGSYLRYYIFSPNSFGTMRVNEFLSDKYLSLFWQHNFGQLIFKSKYFSPNIVLENNLGWGSLSQRERHKNLDFNTMEKGYFETGVLFDGLLKSNVSRVGFGVFYRYGPYALPTTRENLAYKLTVGWIFD